MKRKRCNPTRGGKEKGRRDKDGPPKKTCKHQKKKKNLVQEWSEKMCGSASRKKERIGSKNSKKEGAEEKIASEEKERVGTCIKEEQVFRRKKKKESPKKSHTL